MKARTMISILLALAVLIALAITGCGDDDPKGAMDVVEAENETAMSGDSEGFAAMWAKDAVFVFPDGSEQEVWATAEFPTADYDGDGTPSMADMAQTDVALNPTYERNVEMTCTEVSETVVECDETRTDAFTRAAGVEDPGVVIRTTVEDELIVERKLVGPVGDDWPAIDAFDAAVSDEFTRYEQWVFDTHRDLHSTMFQGSCCTGNVATTTESVELHEEMMPEYLATLD
jgi:hypothetical protein